MYRAITIKGKRVARCSRYNAVALQVYNKAFELWDEQDTHWRYNQMCHEITHILLWEFWHKSRQRFVGEDELSCALERA